MYEIVVGIDGSEPSVRALRFALDAAGRHTDAAVLAVHAYRRPSARNRHAPSYSYLPAGTMQRLATQEGEQRQEQETRARQQAERVVGTALELAGEAAPGTVIKRVVVARDPAKTLIDMSDQADLVVVGGRGAGGFRGLQLGSISQKVLNHARTTVAVVR